jgi:2-hydroxy-3-keto-5-methylthiopentenyl-1-phosphate phosphatase
MRIFCDFDGTISRIDTTDHILNRFAAPAWEDLEADWLAGRITAADCMQAQIGLISASDAQLDAALDAVELTPGFMEFAGWCARHGFALTIVSDGVDRFIRRILARHGLAGLPVISNRLVGDAAARGLDHPWRRAGCAAGSGVCKCAAVNVAAPGEAGPMVFIGDGRSDFCVSARADLLFAKDALAAYASDRGMAFQHFDDFHNVTQALDLVRMTRLAAAG